MRSASSSSGRANSGWNASSQAEVVGGRFIELVQPLSLPADHATPEPNLAASPKCGQHKCKYDVTTPPDERDQQRVAEE